MTLACMWTCRVKKEPFSSDSRAEHAVDLNPAGHLRVGASLPQFPDETTAFPAQLPALMGAVGRAGVELADWGARSQGHGCLVRLDDAHSRIRGPRAGEGRQPPLEEHRR